VSELFLIQEEGSSITVMSIEENHSISAKQNSREHIIAGTKFALPPRAYASDSIVQKS
jgi:hypothetical protein